MHQRKGADQSGGTSIDSHLVIIFSYVNKLVMEFYENTLEFKDTLSYVHLINTINSEAYRMMRFNHVAVDACTDINEAVLVAETEFKEFPAIRHVLRNIRSQNELYIKELLSRH